MVYDLLVVQVDILGTLLLVLQATYTPPRKDSSRAPSESTAEMAPRVNGTMVLYSAAYPGPGFTGTYDWNGTLKLEPDPFKRLREMNKALEVAAGGSSSSSGVRKVQRLLQHAARDQKDEEHSRQTS